MFAAKDPEKLRKCKLAFHIAEAAVKESCGIATLAICMCKELKDNPLCKVEKELEDKMYLLRHSKGSGISKILLIEYTSKIV